MSSPRLSSFLPYPNPTNQLLCSYLAFPQPKAVFPVRSSSSAAILCTVVPPCRPSLSTSHPAHLFVHPRPPLPCPPSPLPPPRYKEYRDTTLNGAIGQMYSEMASRHRVRYPCIQVSGAGVRGTQGQWALGTQGTEWGGTQGLGLGSPGVQSNHGPCVVGIAWVWGTQGTAVSGFAD